MVMKAHNVQMALLEIRPGATINQNSKGKDALEWSIGEGKTRTNIPDIDKSVASDACHSSSRISWLINLV